MKENYCSFEQAVKLKELGFAEKVNHSYLKKICIEPELSVGNLKEVHSKDPKNYNDNRKGTGKGLFFYSAPRLDQAQKWLREKGIIAYTKPIVKSVGDEELQEFKYILKGYRFHVIKLDNAYHLTSYDYPTDELALSAGIDVALELLTDKLNDK